MTRCERCQDRLLDHIYGLLEGSDLEEARAHLDTCPECRSAFEKVQSQQKLMARAARAINEVAEFALPSAQPAANPATLPMIEKPASHRPLWRRSWVAWSAAAAVLIAVSASISYYRVRVDGFQTIVAEKRQEHKQVADQFAALPVKYEARDKVEVGKVHAKAGSYLHVVGPTTLQPGAKGHLHITAHRVEGTPRQLKSDNGHACVRVRVTETQPGQPDKVIQMLPHLKCDDDGQAVVELNAAGVKANSTLKVVVDTDSGRSRIEETVRVLAPAFVTRIDTNKIAYQFNDVLFFRALVLDRYTLQPVSVPVALRVDLTRAGQAVRTLNVTTTAGGMAAGEFEIDAKFAEGGYTLAVHPVAAASTVQAAAQRVDIVRDLRVPDLQFDQETYQAGDKARIFFKAESAKASRALINDVPVPITVAPLPSAAPVPVPMPGGLSGKSLPKAGGGGPDVAALHAAAPRQMIEFTVPTLPPGVNRVPFAVEFADGANKKELRGNLPITPTEFMIDFFPEGGDLIAGLPNRVFYRVRTKTGEPVTGEGRVMLLAGAAGIPEADSDYQLGMGYLDFTPQPKESYIVRIKTPAKMQDLAFPSAKLGIRLDGVVIQVADLGDEHEPRAVGNQGDPIRVTLRQQGASRKLLVAAQCRGQIVDQRWVDLRRDPVDITLQPTQEAVGMIRVTAYELHKGVLQPIAERLVYRAATQRLDLGFALNTQQINPSKNMTAKITARDEKGESAKAWVLASVVDERLQNAPRSLSAHFFLLNEIRTGADLDNAQMILHDSAESAQVLERFLGTHGWRRFTRIDDAPVGRAEPMVFSRENTPLEQMQKDFEGAIAKLQGPIRVEAFEEREKLESARDQAAEAVALAVINLNAFEESFQGGFRLALGLLLAALFAASLILMGVGGYRLIATDKPATATFGGAFVSLTACLALFFVGTWLGPIGITAPPSLIMAHGPRGAEVQAALNERFAMAAPMGVHTDKAATGAFALNAAGREEMMMGKAGADTDKVDALRMANAATARGMSNRDGFVMKYENENAAKGTSAWNDRRGAFGKHLDKNPLPPKAKKDGKKGDAVAEKTERGVEYAYQFEANMLADTLLWRPTLMLETGAAEVRFDIAPGNATYRVLLLGHTATGRFGFYETRLDVLGR